MDKNTNLLIIGAVAVGAYLFLKKPLVPSANDEGNGGYNTPLPIVTLGGNNPVGIDITKLPVGEKIAANTGGSGAVKDANKAQLTAIDKQAKADAGGGAVVFYPDYGIVTKGGLGYSTATPEKYINQKAVALTSSSSVSSNPYAIKGFL